MESLSKPLSGFSLALLFWLRRSSTLQDGLTIFAVSEVVAAGARRQALGFSAAHRLRLIYDPPSGQHRWPPGAECSGQWIDVPPVSGSLVMNVGDMLMRWTNDTYVSTLHRVMNLSTKARLSISLFVWPNPRAQIVSLETCTAGRPSLYEP